VKDGILALLGSILKQDFWVIATGVPYQVGVNEGLPEGGKTGNLTFNHLPESLVKMLVSAECGVATTSWMPSEWAAHEWSGMGTPCSVQVATLLGAFRRGLSLPPSSQLTANRNLEASAARALDLRDPHRLPILLQADDPVIMASSVGEMARVLKVVSSWCTLYKAEFHNSGKTVLQVVGPPDACMRIKRLARLYFQGGAGKVAALLGWKDLHKWLGLLWSADGTWSAHVAAKLGLASSLVACLVGYLQSGAVPLAVVMEAFELKIEGALRFGRWLWGMCPAAQAALDSAYEKWARLFIGADPWRSGARALCELEWSLTGEARVVIDAACKRADLMDSAGTTLAGRLMEDGLGAGQAEGWVNSSASLLSHWGILDWDVWCTTASFSSCSRDGYKKYVKSAVVDASGTSIRRLLTGTSCVDRALAAGFRSGVVASARSGVSWQHMLRHRALIQLRGSCLRLGHWMGGKSSRTVLSCVACNSMQDDLLSHICCVCPAFVAQRSAVEACHGGQMECWMLCTGAGEPGFLEVLEFAAAVSETVASFWSRR